MGTKRRRLSFSFGRAVWDFRKEFRCVYADYRNNLSAFDWKVVELPPWSTDTELMQVMAKMAESHSDGDVVRINGRVVATISTKPAYA